MAGTGRLAVGFDDQRYQAQSFYADNSTITFDATKADGAAATMIGKAVTLTATADTVALCADGENVVGKLLKVEPDLLCTVQIKGNCTLPGGASASLTHGKRAVGALGAASAKGYIREVATATAAELGRIGPAIWDSADATAVIVDLG